MINPSNYKRIGIPLSEVGKRLAQLNEAVKANNMAIGANSKVELKYGKNETVLAVQLTVYLLDDERIRQIDSGEDVQEEKKNG